MRAGPGLDKRLAARALRANCGDRGKARDTALRLAASHAATAGREGAGADEADWSRRMAAGWRAAAERLEAAGEAER